jgi:hypothetical protein
MQNYSRLLQKMPFELLSHVTRRFKHFEPRISWIFYGPQSWLVHVEASNQWIGLLGKILTGNPWVLPSDWLGFPVKIFPSSIKL